MRIVITGPSGTGKTTLVKQLSDKYNTCGETAREVREEISTDDIYQLEREMFVRQMDKEYYNQGFTIFDRALPDILGFSEYYGVRFPFTINYHYNAVIVLNTYPRASFKDRVEKNGDHARHIFNNYVLPYYEQQYPEKPDIYFIKEDIFNQSLEIIQRYEKT